MSDGLSIPELRSAVAIVLDAVEAMDGSEVPLTADYYWHISSDVAYDPYAAPEAAIVTGQLTDDWAEVRNLLARGASDAMISHDLAHVASLLQWLAVRARPG